MIDCGTRRGGDPSMCVLGKNLPICGDGADERQIAGRMLLVHWYFWLIA